MKLIGYRLIAVVIVLLGVSCGGIDRLPFRGTADLPRPQSDVVDGFVRQTDGEFGYVMLRPAGWNPLHLGDARGYVAPGDARLTLTAVNLRALAETIPDAETELTVLTQFEEHQSLAGWTESIEEVWNEQGLDFSHEYTSAQASIYALTPGPDQTQLIAYVVHDDTPLVIGLVGGVTVDQLRETGVFDDFITMTDSVTTIKYDPTEIDPPLSEE